MYNGRYNKKLAFEFQIIKLPPRSIKIYKNNFLLFFYNIAKEFGVIELEIVRDFRIKQYFYHLMQKGLSKSNANSIFKCIRTFFNIEIKSNIFKIYLIK